MRQEPLETLKQSVLAYIDDFIHRADNPGPFLLKKEHTLRVCREICSLGKHLALPGDQMIAAEAAALLHDIGRFRQYEEYSTFLDKISKDHAALGLEEIEKENMLANCSEETGDLIKKAVQYHNAADLPEEENGAALFLIRMLRDADKLDIWRVVTSHYLSPETDNKQAINLGLEDDGKLSGQAVDALCREQFVRSHMIKRLNDLKLMQISWIFDLNFSWSITRAKKENFIGIIVSTMPRSKELDTGLKHVYAYMDTHEKNISKG